MTTNEPFELEAVPRRVMHLIFLVDTSGSMSGTKIASLNTAVRETLNDIGEISANNGDAQIKVAVLEFSSGAQWMYPQPEPSEDFKWQDLEASGLTSLGAAYSELNVKLSKSSGFMAEPTGSRAPAMILLTDGMPTDDYKRPLEKLKANPWFKAGVKVAVAIGDTDTNVGVLAEFTSDMEAVFTVHTKDQLKNIIRTVSVTASLVASQSASVSVSADGTPVDAQSQMVANMTGAIKTDDALRNVDQGNSTANSGTDNWDKW